MPWVSTGTKLITVRSAGGPGACVIDCETEDRAFVLSGGARVEGFTIRNGLAFFGGAMLVAGDATIADCVFEGNTAGGGGALYIGGSSPTITGCTFTGNCAEVNDGGGVYNGAGSPTLINCLMIGNSASRLGGAIFSDLALLTLRNCTISENTANGGGGITNYAAVEMTMTNCIVWQNHAATGEGLAVQIRSTSSVETVNYSCIQDLGDAFGGVGNIDADPLFVTPNNDNYHLRSCSPAVNAGDPSFVPEPGETDIDGDDRVIDGTVDMGADEVTDPGTTPPGDLDGDCVVGIVDFLALLAAWGPCPDPCPPFCLGDIDGDCNVGINDFLTLLGNWG